MLSVRQLADKLTRTSRAGGGLNESYNQVAQDALQRKLLEAEGQSKSAYANWVGPQSLMSFLNTPGMAQNLGPEQYKAFSQLATNLSMNALGRAGNNNGDPFLSGIGSVLNKFGIGGGRGRNPQSSNIFTQSPSYSGTGANPQIPSQNDFQMGGTQSGTDNGEVGGYGGTMSPEELKDYNFNVKVNGRYVPGWKRGDNPIPQNENVPPQKVNIPPVTPTGLPQTPVTKMAENLKGNGEAGGLNQPAIFSAEESGMKQYNQGQIANIIEQQNKIYMADNERANEAYSQNTLIDGMRDAYSRLGKFEKGNWTKIYDKPLSDAAQELDSKTEQLVQSVAKNSAVTGHVTDATRISAAAQKTGRKFSDDAFKHLANFAEAQNERMQEKPLFDKAFSTRGADPQQTEILWRYYNTMKPFFNNKTHQANDDNLLSWEQFYSDKKNRDAAFSPTTQKAVNKVYRSQTQQPQFLILDSTGKKIAQGSEDDVNRFLKDNKGYKKAPIK